MPSLLLIVFVLQLAIHLVNTVGANTVNELLWTIYNKFPTSTSKAANETPKLRREIVRLKRELDTVSPQNDFARWAKLDRQYNKTLTEYNKKNSSLQATQAKFNSTITTFRWISTNGLRFFLQFWHAKTPIFWLPQGWVPYYVEWILAFPRAPTGSISINVWGYACVAMIKLVSDAIGAVYVLATKPPTVKRKEEPMAASNAEKQQSSSKAEKKEL